jgi:hypothetical protein
MDKQKFYWAKKALPWYDDKANGKVNKGESL